MNKLLLPLGSLLVLLASNGLEAQKYAVRVNIPALVVGNINADASTALSPRLSFHLPVQVNPFSYSIPMPIGLIHWFNGEAVSGFSNLSRWGTMKYNYNLTVQPGIRYWTRGVYNRGFFFGTYATGSFFRQGGDALISTYKEGWSAGAGASVGYSYELSPRWNIEGEIGFGGKYQSFSRYDVDTKAKVSSVGTISPDLSRIGVSLTYLF